MIRQTTVSARWCADCSLITSSGQRYMFQEYRNWITASAPMTFQDSGSTGGGQTYGPLMLGAFIASIPPTLVFIALQKQFLSGFSIDSEK